MCANDAEGRNIGRRHLWSTSPSESAIARSPIDEPSPAASPDDATTATAALDFIADDQSFVTNDAPASDATAAFRPTTIASLIDQLKAGRVDEEEKEGEQKFKKIVGGHRHRRDLSSVGGNNDLERWKALYYIASSFVEQMDEEIMYLRKPQLAKTAAPTDVVAASPLAASLVVADEQQLGRKPSQCCPTYQRPFSPPLSGITENGSMLDLVRYNATQDDDGLIQSFTATYCMPHIEDKPCRFIVSKIQSFSRCVQQYEYIMPALVKADQYEDGGKGSPIRVRDELAVLDYILVPSGCQCELP